MRNIVLTILGSFVVALALINPSQAQPHKHPSRYERRVVLAYCESLIDNMHRQGDVVNDTGQLIDKQKWEDSDNITINEMRQIVASGRSLKAPPACLHIQQTCNTGLDETDAAISELTPALKNTSSTAPYSGVQRHLKNSGRYFRLASTEMMRLLKQYN